jgi:hypothetical protein
MLTSLLHLPTRSAGSTSEMELLRLNQGEIEALSLLRSTASGKLSLSPPVGSTSRLKHRSSVHRAAS